MPRRATATVQLGLAAAPAPAEVAHDGTLRVHTATRHGACPADYDFKVAVKNGKVACAGYWPATATGRIARDGAVQMRVSHGGRHVNAHGQARGSRASGRWTSPRPHCSGSWTARRA